MVKINIVCIGKVKDKYIRDGIKEFSKRLSRYANCLLYTSIPDALDLLLTPFLVFLIMSTLGLFVIGPIFHSLENYILIGTEWILKLPFGIAGIIIGGLQQLIVVTGVHHIFNLSLIHILLG